MAISLMQKLALVFPRKDLDAILESLQALQVVQIRPLEDLPDLPEDIVASGIGRLEQPGEAASQASYHQELEAAIRELNHHLPQAGLLAGLRAERSSLDFASLEDFGREGLGHNILTKVQDQLNRLRYLEDRIDKISLQIQDLEKWRSLGTTPKALAAFRHIQARIGTLPNAEDDFYLRTLEADQLLSFDKVFQSETEHGLIIFSGQSELDLDQHLLDHYAFKALDYHQDILPKDLLDQWEREREADSQERQVILAYLSQAREDLQALETQLDYSLSQQARQESKRQLLASNSLVALEGWVEASQFSKLARSLEAKFGQTLYIEASDVEEGDWDQVPIKLENHALVEPFETVTEMYALPKYYEKDPTPILAPFYFVFFGMMVADIGYGFLVWLGTLLALKTLKLDKGLSRFLRFFNLLGIATLLWGFIYGSFFGFELPFKLISTTTDVMTILILSVAFGFITLFVGLFLGGQQKLRMKDYAGAYNDGFAWCMILLGIALLVLGSFVPNLSLLAVLGKWLAILNALGILMVSVLASKSLAGLGSGLYNLYNASGYVGDLVSFTRLMALGLSGASIGSAFNLIVGLMPPIGRFTAGILLFVVLHLVNLFLSLLSGYVHGARLIFVELFGKFYEGGGKPFQPLKPAEKYLTIKQETHLEE